MWAFPITKRWFWGVVPIALEAAYLSFLYVGRASDHAASFGAVPAEHVSEAVIPKHLRNFEQRVGFVERGKALFHRLGCSGCHSTIVGEASYGPNMGVVVRQLRTSQLVIAILDPARDYASGYGPNDMPGNFAELLSEQDLADLLVYLSSLR